MVENPSLDLAINKLGHNWPHLNWEFRDVVIDGNPNKMSQWQGDSTDDIMVVVFKGKHISEPFHRQDFFFIDYAYAQDYNALSAKYDNLVTVREGDCYIGQPFSGYALRGDSLTEEIIMIGVHIKKETFFREYLPALSTDEDMFRFFLDPHKNKFSDEFIHLSFEKSSPIRTLLELMVIEYADKKEDTQLILKPMLLSLFMYIARKYRLEKSSPADSCIVGTALRYIVAHPESVTLGKLAGCLGYNATYISALLKKETGKTFSELVLEKRMERAVFLLKGTTLSIEEIAAMLGYGDQSNFYRSFKKYYGITPRNLIDKGKDIR